jgi:hypothetical protein
LTCPGSGALAKMIKAWLPGLPLDLLIGPSLDLIFDLMNETRRDDPERLECEAAAMAGRTLSARPECVKDGCPYSGV